MPMPGCAGTRLIVTGRRSDSTRLCAQQQRVKNLRLVFGDVHHIRIAEGDVGDSVEWITECLARLFIHSRLYQCSRYGKLSITDLAFLQ